MLSVEENDQRFDADRLFTVGFIHSCCLHIHFISKCSKNFIIIPLKQPSSVGEIELDKISLLVLFTFPFLVRGLTVYANKAPGSNHC